MTSSTELSQAVMLAAEELDWSARNLAITVSRSPNLRGMDNPETKKVRVEIERMLQRYPQLKPVLSEALLDTEYILNAKFRGTSFRLARTIKSNEKK